VHPQLPGSKECGCKIWSDSDRVNSREEKKYIRICRKARDADAQLDKFWKNQEIRGKKSASAIAEKQGMRMQD